MNSSAAKYRVRRKRTKHCFTHTHTDRLIRIHYCWFFFLVFCVRCSSPPRLSGQKKKKEFMNFFLLFFFRRWKYLFVLFGYSCFLVVRATFALFRNCLVVFFTCCSDFFSILGHFILILRLSCFALHSESHTNINAHSHYDRLFVLLLRFYFRFIYFKVWQHCTNQLFRISHLTRATIITTKIRRLFFLVSLRWPRATAREKKNFQNIV